MKKTATAMQESVMRRVYFIYYARKFVNPFALKLSALLCFAVLVNVFVSIRNVLGNTPSFYNIPEVWRFYFAAFLNAKFIVQLILLGAAIVFGLLLWDGVKAFRAKQIFRLHLNF